MFDFGMKLVMLLCNDTNSLVIVTPDRRCAIELEIDASEESHLFLHLRASKGEREQFGFCSGFCDCALYSRFQVDYESTKFECVALRAPSSLRLVSVRGVRGSEEERIAVRRIVTVVNNQFVPIRSLWLGLAW